LRYKVAHIAVRAPYNSGPEIIEKAKKWIEALADSIEQGSTFEHIAKVYSEDKQSAVLGGELPWSNPGQFVPEFEDVCFNLEKKGDISEPVKTYFGWHLIKLIDTEDHGSFEDHREDFEKKVKRDPDRQKAIDQSIVNKIYAKYDIAEHHENVKPFVNLVDSLTFSGIWIKKKGENMNEPIITIEETNYTQKDFNEFLTKYARRQKIIPKEAYINQYFERFKKQMLFEFENRKLAEKDEDFRNLMQEYHDGILLFELTDQMVWSKAVKDTAGLKAFHEKNKKNYMWEKRIEAEIYTCKSENLAKKAMKLASKKTKKGYDNGFIINKICKDDSTNTCIKIVSSTYEKDDNEIIAEVEWKEGISELINIDDKFVFVNIKKIREPEPKTLYEARGLITADYQNYLEEEWIKELRGKYTIEVNKELLSSIE
jgi:peptidyl-prolyl cis-trans isomerase SurA